ncbi:MAG: methionine--tRNA ligase [bacterium]|nr:methionine--tRNA ligase [bacterium]
MDKRFYVTTPIYYVNAEPHIGHAYSTILADFMARFNSLLGNDSYFLTGTDEHGDKIAESAEAGNTSPEEYSNVISSKFRQAWDDIGIEYSDFIRTTEERHIKVVREILQKVYDAGDIYFGSYGGYYCVGCERFLTEKEMVDGKCPDHNKELQFIEEKNYFFKMSKYQDWLIQHIADNPDFIRPERYKNEVLSLLKGDALEDLCISRPKSRLSWGVALPFDEEFVTYVWFDALINYISALGYPNDEKFKKYWPSVEHIIAKDIVKPHGVFWPTMLKAAGIEPYHHLNVHGYWNMQDAKMSKSLGNVVSPTELVNKYGNDQVRYFFLREMTFGLDAKFSEEAIVNRVNYDLANDLGNLVRRSFNMVDKYFDSAIPSFDEGSASERDDLSARLKESVEGYIKYASNFQTSIGIEKLWEFVRHLNKYIDERKPWQLAKENKTAELASCMRNLLESIYSVAVLLDPVLINSSPAIIKGLQAENKPVDVESLLGLNLLDEGKKISDVGILFPRLEKEEDDKGKKDKKEKAKEGKKKKGDSKEAQKIEDDGLLDFKEFLKVDIRVAKVLEAEKVEGSDKLLELQVDSGLDTRTIIAGIAQTYSPDSLVGKKILLVANLKPATIFKRKSYGMLLAAKKEKNDNPVLIEIDDNIPVGAKLS